MRWQRLAAASVVLLWALNASAQSPNPLASEMTRLGVTLAVVLPTSSIDDYPLWSPDSRFLLANVAARGWWKIDLSSVVLNSAAYRGRTVGALAKGSTVTQAQPEEVAQARRVSPEVKGDLSLSDGTQLSWNANGSFGSRLAIQQPGKPAESVWETDLTACGYLILSPDQTYVAVYCEQTGVIVFRAK